MVSWVVLVLVSVFRRWSAGWRVCYLYSGKYVCRLVTLCAGLFPVRGYYGGVTCDQLGNVLATRTEKSRHYVQVSSAQRVRN